MVTMPGFLAFDAFATELGALSLTLHAMRECIHADFHCSAAERAALNTLSVGESTVPRMARSRNVSRQAMQRTIDSLIARKWVRAIRTSPHEKSLRIALLPEGRQVLVAQRGREAHALERLRFPLDDADLEEVTARLTSMRNIVANAWAVTRRRRSAAGSR